jgi:hypothetical protein
MCTGQYIMIKSEGIPICLDEKQRGSVGKCFDAVIYKRRHLKFVHP